MKIIILAALICSTSAFAVNSKKIESNFKIMCKLAKSCQSYTGLQGNTVNALLLSLGDKIEGNIVPVIDLGDNSPEIDGVDYGTITMNGALNMVDNFLETESLTEAQANKIKSQIIDLKDSGVEFGFTPNQGGAVCGIVFPSLLLIDTAKKSAHSLAMFGFPDC